MVSPGYVKFVINGKEYRLDAFQGDAKSTKLFFIFSDETNGEETYGGGRFMYSDILENGKVDLNFNRAYNPPCSYTPYFTCPLLKISISEGEYPCQRKQLLKNYFPLNLPFLFSKKAATPSFLSSVVQERA